MTEKILVTGGAGFIGSHIVDLLIEKGYDVVVIDDLSRGNISNVNKKAKFYKINLLSPDLFKIFEKENFDAVIHDAAKTSVRISMNEPALYTESNVIGTINLLECCRKFNVNRVIYAGSSSRYGNPKYLPCDESHPVNPISPYALSKYMAERYISMYSALYGIKYTILVYSNVYGPRQDSSNESGVIPIFINNLVHNQKPVIFGDGNQTRDFSYVEDIAYANFLALTDKNAENKTINICPGAETSVNYILEELKRIFKTDIQPIHQDPIKGEIRNIFLSNNFVKQELNWAPQISINEGLRRTAEHYKSQHKSL